MNLCTITGISSTLEGLEYATHTIVVQTSVSGFDVIRTL